MGGKGWARWMCRVGNKVVRGRLLGCRVDMMDEDEFDV